jgi:hypothetical protein
MAGAKRPATTRLGPQNAKAILDIVVCDALDEAGNRQFRPLQRHDPPLRRGPSGNAGKNYSVVVSTGNEGKDGLCSKPCNARVS